MPLRPVCIHAIEQTECSVLRFDREDKLMSKRTEDQPNVTDQSDPEGSASGPSSIDQRVVDQNDSGLKGNPARVARTRGRIFAAVISCLDDLGYAECSINRVQTRAGVSRGALTHHFPSREEMMVKTLEHLLDPVRGPSRPGEEANLLSQAKGSNLQDELHRLWARVINTREGRALMEILVASRTDAALSARITPSLWAYNDEFNRNIAHIYQATSGQPEQLSLLWSICRSFMRGLHTQAPYEQDPEIITKMVDLFGQIMAPHLSARAQETLGQQEGHNEEPL